jgi:hypothetical protein
LKSTEVTVNTTAIPSKPIAIIKLGKNLTTFSSKYGINDLKNSIQLTTKQGEESIPNANIGFSEKSN